jgi:hypothetical protein
MLMTRLGDVRPQLLPLMYNTAMPTSPLVWIELPPKFSAPA